MKKTVRGKFPDDARDDVLTKGKIVSMVPMFKPVTFWQWKLFGPDGMPTDNNPRKLAPDCTSAFCYWGLQSLVWVNDLRRRSQRGAPGVGAFLP